jgi:hypothetical protein
MHFWWISQTKKYDDTTFIKEKIPRLLMATPNEWKVNSSGDLIEEDE